MPGESTAHPFSLYLPRLPTMITVSHSRYTANATAMQLIAAIINSPSLINNTQYSTPQELIKRGTQYAAGL